MDAKTNPMRLLDRMGIQYGVHTLPPDAATSGSSMADLLGQDHSRVFKTLVTVAKSKKHYVFVIPVDLELDLKKAAAAVGEKSVEMTPSKELLGLTGYVHLGCSPLCMRREFVTAIDTTVNEGEKIFVSAGKLGIQLELRSEDLLRSMKFIVTDLTRPKAVR